VRAAVIRSAKERNMLWRAANHVRISGPPDFTPAAKWHEAREAAGLRASSISHPAAYAASVSTNPSGFSACC
jgi:hypothetical protein